MEFVFALALVLLATLGLGVGLLFTGRPPQGSCGGLSCIASARCEGCPRHPTGENSDD